MTQINITKIVFKLLSFAKLSRKNRAAKNLRRNREVSKSTRSALIIAQNCAAKNSRRSGAIANPKFNMGQQQYRAKQCCKEFAALWSLKSNTGQPQLPRKARLQRICGAAAQSRSPRISKGQQPLPRSRKCANHAKYVQQRNMCTIRHPTPNIAFTTLFTS